MPRRQRSGLLFAAILFLIPAAARAQDADLNAPLVPVSIETGQTLRDLVASYLADPDLWPVVLDINGIASIGEVRPGTVLMLPVGQVAAANVALANSLGAIQSATAEGARLFAPREISEAIDGRESAVAKRGEGAWSDAVALSGAATARAEEALRISLEQRDRAAEALLTDVHGSVEGRAPAQALWTDRRLDDILVEFERIRTRSASTAQVTFRDLSRLRLNPNSNAIIQTMRTDPLTGSEVTEVSLLSGDFYALLNQLAERTRFEIDVDGIRTSTESADFWVQNAGEAARFANYDDAELRIGEGDDAITLGENEGAIIGRDGRSQVSDVLARPRISTPAQGSQVLSRDVALGWEPTPDAAGYWLEVAADEAFTVMQLSEWGIPEPRYQLAAAAPGAYHWRVAALDRFGLPGEWSVPSSFDVLDDTTPPFLVIASPVDASVLDTALIEVVGETEPGATVTLNGAYLDVGAEGRFSGALDATAGSNTLLLEAVDAAGNRAERAIDVTYRPAEAVTVEIDAALSRDETGRLLTKTEDLALRAATDAAPGAPVRLVATMGEVIAQTLVDAEGGISLNVPASEGGRTYRLEVLGPSGAVEGRAEIAAIQDAAPPEIRFEEPPPQATAATEIHLRGTAEDATSLRLDGSEVELSDGRFAVRRDLLPGLNALEFVARDRAGNVQVAKVVVNRDDEPPVITDARLSRDGAARRIELVVAVLEEVGLRSVGRYTLSVGGVEETGLLRCDPGTSVCRASLPDRAGELRILGVTVEDYAGNVGTSGG